MTNARSSLIDLLKAGGRIVFDDGRGIEPARRGVNLIQLRLLPEDETCNTLWPLNEGGVNKAIETVGVIRRVDPALNIPLPFAKMIAVYCGYKLETEEMDPGFHWSNTETGHAGDRTFETADDAWMDIRRHMQQAAKADRVAEDDWRDAPLGERIRLIAETFGVSAALLRSLVPDDALEPTPAPGG